MRPIKIELKNYQSHSHSIIDFDTFDVALMVGKNGSGKSSLLNSIRWVLFDKSKHKKKDGIVKRDTTACEVIFTFAIRDQVYKISRKRNKVMGESDVVFEQLVGTEFKAIGCDTNTATDAKITEIINFNHDIFINSVYFGQGDISIFSESTPSKKKEILKSLLKLSKWDAYQKQAKKYTSGLNSKINEKHKYVIPLTTIDNELKKYNYAIDHSRKAIALKNKTYKRLNSEFLEKQAELQLIENDQLKNELDTLNVEFQEDKRRLSVVSKKIIENEEVIESNTSNSSKLKERIIFYIDSINAAKDIDLDNKRTNILNGKAKSKVMKDKIVGLEKSIQLNGECDECLRPISKTEANKIVELRRTRLNTVKNEYDALIKKIKNAESKFKRLEDLEDDAQNANIKKTKAEFKIKMLKSDIDRAIEDNNSLYKDRKRLQGKDLKDRIDDIKSKLDEKNITTLKNSLTFLEESIFSTKKVIDKSNIDLGSNMSAMSKLKITRKEQVVLQDEVTRLSNQLEVFDKVKHGFGKDGIQSVIIENVIDELENYTNETLMLICNEPISISINTQKQNDDGGWNETFDININLNGRIDPFEAFSGGEQFRISFALRIALSKILSERMGGEIKLLLLDEVSSSLDEDGIELFVDIVKKLSKEMKILVISHDEKLKESFEDTFIVTKDVKGSKIVT